MHRIDDKEILDFIARTESFYPADANLATAEENRRLYDAMCVEFRQPRPTSVAVEDRQISHVPIRIYRPEGSPKESDAQHPEILYAHGGGFVVGGLDSHDDICAEIAARCGLVLTSFYYRLAPEYPFPAQLDDMAIVFDDMQRRNHRIITMGDSAGGHLCAGLALRLRRQSNVMPQAQILIYPGLGGDMSLPSYKQNAEAPLLRTKDLAAYRAAVGQEILDAVQREESAPLSASDFSSLPPTYVFSADIDPLRDDGRVYVERLQEAGVKAEWRNDAQLVHGYLRGRLMSRRIACAFDAICDCVKKAAA